MNDENKGGFAIDDALREAEGRPGLSRRTLLKAAGASAAALALGGSLGMYAYFTGADTKVNRASVAENLNVRVVEPAWDPQAALAVAPGQHVPKDPRVENLHEKIPGYLFLEVRVPAAFVEVYDPSSGEVLPAAKTQLFAWEAGGEWVELQRFEDGEDIVYRYGWPEPVGPGDATPPLFEEVVFANLAEAQGQSGEKALTVTAYGIQSHGFDNCEDAWQAYKLQNGIGDGEPDYSDKYTVEIREVRSVLDLSVTIEDLDWAAWLRIGKMRVFYKNGDQKEYPSHINSNGETVTILEPYFGFERHGSTLSLNYPPDDIFLSNEIERYELDIEFFKGVSDYPHLQPPGEKVHARKLAITNIDVAEDFSWPQPGQNLFIDCGTSFEYYPEGSGYALFSREEYDISKDIYVRISPSEHRTQFDCEGAHFDFDAAYAWEFSEEKSVRISVGEPDEDVNGLVIPSKRYNVPIERVPSPIGGWDGLYKLKPSNQVKKELAGKEIVFRGIPLDANGLVVFQPVNPIAPIVSDRQEVY